MDKINYIVVFYLGTRRVNTVSSSTYFIRKHLNFLQDNKIDLARVTVVLNSDIHDETVEFLEVIRSFKPYYTDLRVVIRENKGLSYAGWNEVINSCIENDEEFTHYFLMEDDYYPGCVEFIDMCKSKMVGDVGYVCGAQTSKSLASLFKVERTAGMSIGMLKGEAAEAAYNKYGSSLVTLDNESKDGYGIRSLQIQAMFLDFVLNSGYSLIGMEDISSSIFLHNRTGHLFSTIKQQQESGERSWFLAEYGDPDKPRVFEPIVEWSLYKPTGIKYITMPTNVVIARHEGEA